MARNFERASSQRLVNAGAPVTAYPLTMACWFRASEALNNKYLISIGDSAALSWFGLEATSSETVQAEAADAGLVRTATATGNFSIDTWTHAAAVFASSTSRSAYRDGTNKATDTYNWIPTGLDKVSIGVRNSSAYENYFSGDIAEAAIWDVALTDAEIAMLAKGASPVMVRPASLVSYWPLIGRESPEPDRVGGYNLTLTNAPIAAAHPRIFYVPKPKTLWIGQPPLIATMAATEAPDVAAFTVERLIDVSMAATEAADIAAATLNIGRNITLAATEAPDTFAGTVSTGAGVTLAATEAPDTFAGSAIFNRFATMAATEAPDIAAAVVKSPIHVSMAASEAPDAAAFAVKFDLEISLSASEAADTFAAAVTVPYPPLAEIVQNTSPGALVFLYELDLTAFGAGIARFTPMVSRDGPDYTEVKFGGNVFTPIPLMAKGFEKSAKGALARPRLQISNVTNLVTQLLRDYGDLKGVRLTRIRTFAQYLDAPDGVSPDTGQTLPVEEYIISRKAQHNKVFVEFELRAAIDIEGVVIPKRVLLRNCMARYRIWDATTETFTYDTSDMACPYAGSFYFDKTDSFTANPASDRCSKNVDGCKARFGERAVLPFMGFPGAARVR